MRPPKIIAAKNCRSTVENRKGIILICYHAGRILADCGQPWFNFEGAKGAEGIYPRQMVDLYNLPSWVGRKTMSALVEKGIVEVVDPDAGPYSNSFGWRLVNPAFVPSF